MSRVCETLWGAIQKVKDAAVADEALLLELGLTAIERELVRIDPGYVAVSPTARLDSFLTEDAYSFVELNGESPAGIAYADAAYEIFSALPVMRQFAEKYHVRRFNGRPLMLDTLLQAHSEYLGRKQKAPRALRLWTSRDCRHKKSSSFQRIFRGEATHQLYARRKSLSFGWEITLRRFVIARYKRRW